MIVFGPTIIFVLRFTAARISASLTKSTGRGLGAGAAEGGASGLMGVACAGAAGFADTGCLPARKRSTARATDQFTATPVSGFWFPVSGEVAQAGQVDAVLTDVALLEAGNWTLETAATGRAS